MRLLSRYPICNYEMPNLPRDCNNQNIKNIHPSTASYHLQCLTLDETKMHEISNSQSWFCDDCIIGKLPGNAPKFGIGWMKIKRCSEISNSFRKLIHFGFYSWWRFRVCLWPKQQKGNVVAMSNQKLRRNLRRMSLHFYFLFCLFNVFHSHNYFL